MGQPLPDEKEKALTTEPMRAYEIMSRIAHEPSTDDEVLDSVEGNMLALKVGESYEWYVAGYGEDEQPLVITRVDAKRFTLQYPAGHWQR